MRQIRVLQMIDSLQAGGAEMVTVNLANELSKQEAVDSYLLSYRSGGDLEKRITAGVKYFVLNKKQVIDLWALWKLYKFFRKQNFDIVHAHSTSFYYPVILKRFFKYKLVWHDHHSNKMILNNGKRKNPLKVFGTFFDHSFTISRHLLESGNQFRGYHIDKLSILPDFSITHANKEAAAAAQFFELKGSRYERVVYLANLLPHKDHINLLRAFKLVLKLRPTSYLYLVGKGNGDAYEKKVLQVIKNLGLQYHVKWLGTVAYPSEILDHCAIGVISSEVDGLPLAVMEYGLSNLAVVATTVGEIPLVLTHDVHALLVPPKNPEAMAAALLTLLNNKPKMIELHQNLSKLVSADYSVNAVMNQLMGVYHGMLQTNAYKVH